MGQYRRPIAKGEGRTYKGCYLQPTADGWKSVCFGNHLSGDTLAEIKQLVTENYPHCLRTGRRASW